MALHDVRVLSLVEVAQALNDLVLTRKIDFLKCVLHPDLQLNYFTIRLLNSLVLRVKQVLEIMALLLQLAKCLLPSVLSRFFIFLHLNNLEVKLVVLLGQPLIFLLEREERLLIKLLIMLNH
uniref:Uncharacterized protein n=1 Tax=Strombidium inclinatum TaxID=197538 RepID=A0A7S3MUF6_9SPIT